MTAWLLTFAATCTIELAIMRWIGPSHRRRMLVGFCAQLATHPFVWIAMSTLSGQLPRLACVELWATLVEAAVYKRFLGLRGRDAFALSAIANAASLLFVSSIAVLI